jgi:hypothetical protein
VAVVPALVAVVLRLMAVVPALVAVMLALVAVVRSLMGVARLWLRMMAGIVCRPLSRPPSPGTVSSLPPGAVFPAVHPHPDQPDDQQDHDNEDPGAREMTRPANPERNAGQHDLAPAQESPGADSVLTRYVLTARRSTCQFPGQWRTGLPLAQS